jgi:hypothetical protein
VRAILLDELEDVSQVRLGYLIDLNNSLPLSRFFGWRMKELRERMVNRELHCLCPWLSSLDRQILEVANVGEIYWFLVAANQCPSDRHL